LLVFFLLRSPFFKGKGCFFFVGGGERDVTWEFASRGGPGRDAFCITVTVRFWKKGR